MTAAIRDPLGGLTVDQARVEVIRLIQRAQELVAHLARYEYAEGNPVGRTLRAELETCTREANELEMRLIEIRSRTRDGDTRFDAFHHAYRARHGR